MVGIIIYDIKDYYNLNKEVREDKLNNCCYTFRQPLELKK